MASPPAITKFAPEEFDHIVNLAIRSGQRRQPAVLARPLTDVGPYADAALALREFFGDDTKRFESAMDRFTAFMYLFSQGRLGRWVKPSPGNPKAQDIHPAVVHVAAQMGLTRNSKFPEKRFLKEVKTVAAAHYADLQGWS